MPIHLPAQGRAAPAAETGRTPVDAAAFRDAMQQRQQALRIFRRAAANDSSAGNVIAQALDLACRILQPDRCAYAVRTGETGGLVIRAGVGWAAGVVGRDELLGTPNSLSGYTLALGRPVVVEDFRLFPQLARDPALDACGTISALTAPVRGQHAPLGLLGIFSSRRRLFSPDDADFLRGLADVIAAASYREDWRRQMALPPRRHSTARSET